MVWRVSLAKLQKQSYQGVVPCPSFLPPFLQSLIPPLSPFLACCVHSQRHQHPGPLISPTLYCSRFQQQYALTHSHLFTHPSPLTGDLISPILPSFFPSFLPRPYLITPPATTRHSGIRACFLYQPTTSYPSFRTATTNLCANSLRYSPWKITS